FKVNRNGRFLINGEPQKLRGASFHEDSPDRGAALTPQQRQNYVTWLQELGANFTRAHYPVHPAFLEEFDRLGIVYYDQVPFYQYRAETLRLKSVRTKGLAYLSQAVARDANHASVAVWSIANELPTRVSPGQRNYVNAAKRLLDKEDPTRLATIDYAGYPSIPPIGPYRVLDGIGINSYFGWYIGPNGQIVDRELLGPYMDQLHAYYPRQALFITEFGAESNREGPIDEKGTFAFQADFMDYHVSTYESRPYINGFTAWILQDFKVRPDWDGGNPKPSPPYNGKGLIDPNGVKKPAFFETQRLYRGAAAAENGR
nr:hypothetical protein [Thermoleophilaceae bacterium]